MFAVLPRDGEWSIYRVEFLSKDDQRWRDANMFHQYVPREVREREPCFNEFSASGAAWQETRIQGSFDSEPAWALCRLLAQYSPDYRFRVVLHKVYQERTELMRTTTGDRRAD
jgi:hypothetical protein